MAGAAPFRHRVGLNSVEKGSIQLRLFLRAVVWATFAIACSLAFAQQPDSGAQAASKEDGAITKLEKSPWLLAPLFSSNPKLGTDRKSTRLNSSHVRISY